MSMTTYEKLKKKVRTYETQESLLLEWHKNWYDDQRKVIRELEYALRRHDLNEIGHIVAILQGMTDKRFGTLKNMIYVLCDKDRNGKLYSEDDFKYDELEEDHKNLEEKNTNGNELYNINNNDHKIQETKKENKIDEVIEFDINEMITFYRGGMSVKNIAEYFKISEHKVIKLLVTYGVYSTDLYDYIKDMRNKGKTDEEIQKILGLSSNAYNKYMPYQKMPYNLDERYISDNARRLRELRKKWNSEK